MRITSVKHVDRIQIITKSCEEIWVQVVRSGKTRALVGIDADKTAKIVTHKGPRLKPEAEVVKPEPEAVGLVK